MSAEPSVNSFGVRRQSEAATALWINHRISIPFQSESQINKYQQFRPVAYLMVSWSLTQHSLAVRKGGVARSGSQNAYGEVRGDLAKNAAIRFA
jgi:hypothetical protein